MFYCMIIMFRIDRVPQMNLSNMIIMFRIERETQINFTNMIFMFRIDRVPNMTAWGMIIMYGFLKLQIFLGGAYILLVYAR